MWAASLPLLTTQVYPGLSDRDYQSSPVVLLFVPSTVLRHGAKSRLSHKPPSWGARSAKCHLSWHAFQVGCNHDCTVLPGPESGLFLLDTEMKAGFSRDGCFGQSFILLSTSVIFAHALSLHCPPLAQSPDFDS